MKRILVIGANGMLGRDLVPLLSFFFPNDEIIGWDLGDIDIRQEQETLLKMEGLRPHWVINAAAYTDVDKCESNVKEAFATNAEGMRHVVLGALNVQARVVYLSTDYVFDGKKGEPYVEEDPPHPLNVYGHSKWKGEQYLQEWMKDALIVRTQWLYGRYGKNFVRSVLQQAQEKKVLRIVDDQMGSPTYTVDLARALCLLIQQGASGVFHAANRECCTWYTFGKTILELSGISEVEVIPISSEELHRPAVRPSYSVLNCDKLRREIGVTLRSWPEALKDYLSAISSLQPIGERTKGAEAV